MRRSRAVDQACPQLRKFWHPAPDIGAVGIELLALQDRIEHAEIGGGIGAGAGDPLPVGGIAAGVGIDQRVPKPFFALAPVDPKRVRRTGWPSGAQLKRRRVRSAPEGILQLWPRVMRTTSWTCAKSAGGHFEPVCRSLSRDVDRPHPDRFSVPGDRSPRSFFTARSATCWARSGPRRRSCSICFMWSGS